MPRPQDVKERDRTERNLLLDALRERPSMWISYAPLEEIAARKQVRFGQHHLLRSSSPSSPFSLPHQENG